ncbi:hypothetical protein AAFF_G00424350 [Aldrovandia affinis]|uniref:Uncharacterized protein n=1 Tax=Aldrovandia affinis TaxID=143900 RepID=A0AAD7X062_9TELE|nr:hypothetical protein AAFF_G00424350 [Aldrovandia affinis]
MLFGGGQKKVKVITAITLLLLPLSGGTSHSHGQGQSERTGERSVLPSAHWRHGLRYARSFTADAFMVLAAVGSCLLLDP